MDCSTDTLNQAFEEVYEPLLALLGDSPRLRLNLYFSALILQHAQAHRPAFLTSLRGLVGDGRVEVLGGGLYDPVLGSIPERDALSQLQASRQLIKQALGKAPQGVWLPLRAWDPRLPVVLARAGLRYTLLDDAQFVLAGLHPGELGGHYTTERAGHPISVFPMGSELSQAVSSQPPGEIKELVSRLGRKRVRSTAAGEAGHLEVLVADGSALLGNGGLQSLFHLLEHELPWVKTQLLDQAWSQAPGSGRLYLPLGARPDLRNWSLPASAVARRQGLIRHMQQDGTTEDVQRLLGGVLWSNFLVKYPEANRLHKRMLRVSYKVDRLRAAAKRRSQAGGGSSDPMDLAQVVRGACDALWRAQNNGVYWHGGSSHLGIYDPDLRRRTFGDLLRAERLVDAAANDPANRGWVAGTADNDADGHDEVSVRSPHFQALVHPVDGGTLSELDLRQAQIALQTSFSGGEEPGERRLEGTEVCLVFDDVAQEGGRDDGADAPDHADWSAVLPRGAFQDHFLGPETTLESFARRQFRELGDFASQPFEVMKVSSPETSDELSAAGAVTVGRSGVVQDTEHSLLLRVEKTFRFEVGRPRLDVLHEIQNRSRDSAQAWHALEWTFGLPSGNPAAVVLRREGDGNEDDVALVSGPADLGALTWFEWVDQEAGLSLVFELDRPVGVWWMPVTTRVQSPDSSQDIVQGNTLVFHSPADAWGEETLHLKLRVDFLWES
mgnify:CR=1 FL=1